jgi:hypothetical protein
MKGETSAYTCHQLFAELLPSFLILHACTFLTEILWRWKISSVLLAAW